MDLPSKPNETAALATVYRLIGRLWAREIDPPFAQELRSDPLRSAYVQVGGTLPSTDDAELENLAHDYCQLFIGPRDHLPPIQSVWQTGSLQGSASDAMHPYLSLLEWTPQGTIVDHVGVQWNVMALIVDQIAVEQARTSNSPDQLYGLSTLAEQFFQDHVAWSESLAVRVQSNAKTDFYKSVGRITEQFVSSETQRFAEPTV